MMIIQQHEPFRIQPKMPAEAYKTYALRLPKQTHYRKATCQEVECDAYANGWATTLDLSTDLGERQAKYIRLHSGRSFTVTENLPLIRLVFASGQQCFADHQVPLEREPVFIVRGGDWRGNPRGEVHTHVRAEHWIEDFAEHQQGIADAIEQG